jgi:hypothetical protein
MRRCRCSAKEAFDLGECLLALDGDAAVIAHYVAEARRRGVGPVLTELLAWAGRLGVAMPVPDADVLDHAEPLGANLERVTDAGELAAEPDVTPNPDAGTTPEPATLAWRVLGTLDPPRVRCPRCGASYVADDDASELPTCPRCGTPNTWEARQPVAFQTWLRAIDACPSRAALAALGRRLYAARLPRAQAGVAWTRYRIWTAALDAATPLSPVARDLLAEIERAEIWALPRLGETLYRRQHAAGAPGLMPAEWRRIWAAYRARQPARPA